MFPKDSFMHSVSRESFAELAYDAEDLQYTLSVEEQNRLLAGAVYSQDPLANAYSPDGSEDKKTVRIVVTSTKAPGWVSVRPPISITERQEGWMDILFDFMLIAAILSLQSIMHCAVNPPGLFTCFVIFLALQRLWFVFVTYVNKFDHHQLFHLILYGCAALGMCNLSLFLDGVQNSEANEEDCYNDPLDDLWQVLRTPKHFIGVYLLFQLLFMLVHLQAGYFLVRTRKHWLCMTFSFGVNSVFWAASLLIPSKDQWMAPFTWCLGLISQELISFYADMHYPGLMLHVPHLCGRLGVFLMILLGQSTFEIVTFTGVPTGARYEPVYPSAVCLIFGISFNIAIGYFYTQPTLLQHHVLRKSPRRSVVWLGAHVLLSFCLLVQGVGVVYSYQHLLDGVNEYSWLMVVGAAGARAMVAFVRLCHKGWQVKLGRTFGYVFRMIIPLVMLLVPLMVELRPKEEQVILMLILVFGFTLVLAVLDIYRRTEDQVLTVLESRKTRGRGDTLSDTISADL